MESRLFRFLPVKAVIAAVLFHAALPSPAHAQLHGDTPKGTTYENYDVRDADRADATPSAVRSNYRTRQVTVSRAAALVVLAGSAASARASLQAAVPTFVTESNSFGTATEIVGTATARQFLTAPSREAHEAVLRGFLAQYAALYSLTAEEAAALVKTADYANPAGNLAWVRLEQRINGLPVFQGEVQAAFTADGALARTNGDLAGGLDASSLPAAAMLTPAQAVAAASASIGRPLNAARLTTLSTEEAGRVATLAGGPFVRATRTELVYFALEPGVATLAYSMVLWEDVNAYYLLVDANDGTLLWRKNITQDQTQNATYNVYTGVSPTPLTPSTVLPGQGTQPTEVARVSVTLVADDLTASPLGWITDGGNATIGNNVTCGLDIDGTNGVDSNVSGVSRVFNFAYNPAPGISGAAGSTSPGDSAYRNGIVTNLFFWTNRYHDRLWELGFTESARNFQTTNTFSGVNRGGSAGDAISAEAQDSSGTNNANFSTPADGSPGRMQMYLFTNTSPVRDGSLDADVFVHEMTHGTSNRLHNNGSGLSTQQAGGMGEGWSDYYARCLLSRADEDVTGLFPSGGYVTYELGTGFHDNYYYGIREFPYAVKSNVGANGKPHNPLTFGNLDLLGTNGLSNGAYPSSPVIGITANEVHNIGHFWCTTLLEMRARLIQNLGYTVGNQRALQIVTDAMKLDGTNPTIIIARDSLIAADNAGFAGADVADIRSAFATRGLGAGSSSTGTTLFTNVESFYPSSVAGAITFSDALGNNNGVADPGEDLVFTVPLTNKLAVSDVGVTARLGTYTASYGTLAANAAGSQTFAYHVPNGTAPGTLLQIPLTVTSPNGTAAVTVPVRVGTPTVNVAFAENFNSTAVNTLPAGWTQTGTVSGSTWAVSASVIDSGNCVFAKDVASASDSSVVSPVIPLTSDLAYQLSFNHRYSFETGYDAGALEISVAGGAFTDIVTAGGSWVQGGYGINVSSAVTTSVLAGRRTWSGLINTTGPVVVNLPGGLSGKTVQIRWRLGSDSSTAGTGWYIDSVQLSTTTYASATIDTDGDGIPDGYETAHGLNPNKAADANADPDGDGVTNLQEYLAGTDPQNAVSHLGITSTTYSAATGVTVNFPGVNGKTYLVEYKDNLLTSTWTTLQSGIVSSGGNVPVTDAGAAGKPARFYRVRVTGQ